jgi:hypothetical protein
MRDSLRFATSGILALALGGCVPETSAELLHEQSGQTIADVTLVAGQPDAFFVTPEGMRGYRWSRPHLVPTGGRRCIYTLYAVQEGRAHSLASWRVVGSEVPEPGCGPLLPARS